MFASLTSSPCPPLPRPPAHPPLARPSSTVVVHLPDAPLPRLHTRTPCRPRARLSVSAPTTTRTSARAVSRRQSTTASTRSGARARLASSSLATSPSTSASSALSVTRRAPRTLADLALLPAAQRGPRGQEERHHRQPFVLRPCREPQARHQLQQGPRAYRRSPPYLCSDRPPDASRLSQGSLVIGQLTHGGRQVSEEVTKVRLASTSGLRRSPR